MEWSAQILQARQTGMNPTHIDSHMLCALANPALAKVYIELGRSNGIPFLISSSLNSEVEHLLTNTDIVVDQVFSLRPGLPHKHWEQYYLRVLRSISPGLNVLIVHLGYDDAELQAVTAGRAFWGAAWRQRDYDAVTSDAFRSALKEYNIQLIGWNKLTSLTQGRPSASEC
jgi:chitin disaccharide deacetylase